MTLPQPSAAILSFQETKQLAKVHYYENGVWGNILNFGMQAAQQNTDLQLLVHNR